MRKLKFLMISIFLFSCNSIEKKDIRETVAIDSSTKVQIVDTVTNRKVKPLENACNYSKIFLKFRESLIEKDFEKLNIYFNYPFKSDEFWDVVAFCSNDSILVDTSKEIITKNDMEKYFDNFFPNEFIVSLKDINVNDLFEGKELTSKPLFPQTDSETWVKCYIVNATFDKSTSKLFFIMYYEFIEEETNEKYEASIGYNFIFEECRLKFDKINLVY